MGVKHTVLPDGQPPTVAFAVLAQLCDPHANEAKMDATLFTNTVRQGIFALSIFRYLILNLF